MSTKLTKPTNHFNTTEPDSVEKSMRKPGRTLLVKSLINNMDCTLFDAFIGLQSKTETKSSNSYFLTFDTVAHATLAYLTLQSDSTYRVKYSYYRVFFTMNGLTDETDYNQVKQNLSDHVLANTKSEVLYCKFYRKDNKFLGCGDFTVDTLDSMNSLLSKESGLKDFTFGSYSGTFYRFNGNSKKDKNNNHSNQA
jgi:hypothetical protein